MRQLIGPLGELDVPTIAELKEAMGHKFDAFIRDFYRGVDYLGFIGYPNALTATIDGPRSGYVWSVKLVGCQLAAADYLTVYPGSTAATAPVGVAQSIQTGTASEVVMTWTSNTWIMKDQDHIHLSSVETIMNYRLLVKQVPAEMLAKL